MKRIVSMFMAVALVLGVCLSRSGAAESKPIAAVAVASYDDLLNDVNFVGSLVERPQLGGAMEGILAFFTQGQGLAGVDKTRPWGAIIQTAGEEEFAGYLFVPVSDFKQALGLLKLYCSVESEGDVYKVTPKKGNKGGYVKQKGAWAFFAEKPEGLAHRAADPVALLGNLKKEYILGGRIFLANVPAGHREKFLSQVKHGLQKDAAQHGGESSEDYATRKKLIDQATSYVTRVLGELDQVVFGWGLDPTAEKTFIDLSVVAKSGTTTAEEMELAAKSTTNFAGFRAPTAAFNATLAGAIPAAKQEIAASLIEVVRGKGLADIDKKEAESRRAVAKEVLNNLADLLQKIVKSGHVDGAATVLLDPKSATGLLAGHVADGALLDKILHTVAKSVVAEHPEFDQFIKLDAEKSDAMNFHKISVPIPENAPDREKAVQLFGEKVDVVIGVGKENACLAVGRNAEALLKKAIAASSETGPKSVLPLAVSLSVKPLASLTAAMGKPAERMPAAMMESELKKTPGKDHVILAIRPISNGVQFHLEVEEGLIRLFGRLVVMSTGMGGQQKPHANPAPFGE